MLRAASSLALILALAALASADVAGFVQSDLGKAKSEALATGKLVFVYFQKPG